MNFFSLVKIFPAHGTDERFHVTKTAPGVIFTNELTIAARSKIRRFYSDWRQGNKVYVYTVPRLNKKRGKILMGLCFCCGIFSLVAQRISGLEKQY